VNGSKLTVNGDGTNNPGGTISTGGSGGSTITINGMLNNSGSFSLGNPGDEASITGHVSNSGSFDLVDSMAWFRNGLDNSGSVSLGERVKFSPGSDLQISGDVRNSGTIYTNGSGLHTSNGNILRIGGELTNEASGIVTIHSFALGPPDEADIGSVDNRGTIRVDDGSDLQVAGNFNNSGMLSAFGGNTVTGLPSFLAIGGTLTNTVTGRIDVDGPGGRYPGSSLSTAVGLSNSGVINVKNGSSVYSPLVSNGGTINIDSLSKFVVSTDYPAGLGYVQLANGTLNEMISSATSFGVINVTGSALLDGALTVLLQGYSPTAGSEFKFLTFTPGELSGMFSDEPGGPWDVIYDNADGYVELKYVPEPATLLVLIPGLLGVGYGLRRKLLQ
jgi:hypothetical protein